MNEEIIVDDIDVSECEDLSRFKDEYCCGKQYEEFASCEGYNCAYKQLKHLQAENERLEQENKELKELKCKFKEYCTCDTERLQAENEQLKSEILMWQEQIEKRNEICDVWVETASNYKQALEEIRSYVNAQLDGFENDVYGITKNQITTITNKINEVLK